MSQVTHLANGALNRSGDRLRDDLHQPADSPSFVRRMAGGETLH